VGGGGGRGVGQQLVGLTEEAIDLNFWYEKPRLNIVKWRKNRA
jgi:hypothetical protein